MRRPMSVLNRPVPAVVETDEVTVVVATRNRPDRLRETVPRHRAATVVVDNGSDPPLSVPGADDRARAVPGSADGKRAAGRAPAVEVIRLGENAGAAARNVGVRRARTPFVAFADDDSYWAPGSLARAAELLHAHPKAALL